MRRWQRSEIAHRGDYIVLSFLFKKIEYQIEQQYHGAEYAGICGRLQRNVVKGKGYNENSGKQKNEAEKSHMVFKKFKKQSHISSSFSIIYPTPNFVVINPARPDLSSFLRSLFTLTVSVFSSMKLSVDHRYSISRSRLTILPLFFRRA